VRARARETALALLAAEPVLVDDAANFFGRESRGVLQLRGNGCLALSDDTLAFAMWFPRRTLVVPRASITAVEATDSHLGKRIGRPLLRIRFTGPDGEPDAAAWYVRDLPRWRATLA
jgi:hypothetical protein